jgi:hypothetical protein
MVEVQDWEANCQACLANLGASCLNIHQDQLIKMCKWKICQVSKEVSLESAQGTHINENAQIHEWYTSIWLLTTMSNFKAISICNRQIGLFRDPICWHHIRFFCPVILESFLHKTEVKSHIYYWQTSTCLRSKEGHLSKIKMS